MNSKKEQITERVKAESFTSPVPAFLARYQRLMVGQRPLAYGGAHSLGALGKSPYLCVLFPSHLGGVNGYSSHGSDMLTQLC